MLFTHQQETTLNRTISIDLILKHAKSFNAGTYPLSVYHDALLRAARAEDAVALAEALYIGLAWKDAKTRVAVDGEWNTLLRDTQYRIERVKPNTYSERHAGVFRTPEFWRWAQEVRKQQHFDASLIDVLRESFGLWTTVVIPAFVLHILNPRRFPLVDRYVVGAANYLTHGEVNFSVNRQAYQDYEAFWQRVLREGGFDGNTAGLHELKQLDNGLWALGKKLSSIQQTDDNDDSVEENAVPSLTTSSAPADAPVSQLDHSVDTGSPAFKRRAVELTRNMTQGQAMVQAAREFGLTLPASYLRYPGSHFDRWRKQGFSLV